MRTLARWFLLTVLVVDAAFAALFFLGGPPTIGAVPDAASRAAEEVGETIVEDSTWTRESLGKLGERLEQRAMELERREAELDELLRGSEVLRRAGLLPGEAVAEAQPPGPDPEPVEEGPGALAFEQLQRAYENMEPDSAAQALAELAGRDQEAVVELLLGWRPRTSGAILDSLTQVDAGLAADLSYEIWKRSGKSAPAVARSGR